MNTTAVGDTSSIKCPDLGVIFFTSTLDAKCLHTCRMIRYSLCVMKIKLSTPQTIAPRTGITLPIANDVYLWSLCKASITQNLNKVIADVLTEKPTSFGKYYTGNSCVPVNVKWQEDNGRIITHSINVDVSLELYASQISNTVKCAISIDGKCYGKMQFRAVIK